jgi:hypothetical protein
MGTAQLQLADCDTVAAFQLAPDASAVRGAEVGPTTGHLIASLLRTLLASTMLDTKSGGALRGLVAPFNFTAAPPTVGCAQVGPSHGRLCATLVPASLASAVRSAEKLVAGPLITSRKRATPTAAVSNAKSCTSLSTLVAALGFTNAIPAMGFTIRSARQRRTCASNDTTRTRRSQAHARIHQLAEKLIRR